MVKIGKWWQKLAKNCKNWQNVEILLKICKNLQIMVKIGKWWQKLAKNGKNWQNVEKLLKIGKKW